MVPKNGRINLTIRPSDALSITSVLTNIICTIQVSSNYHKIDLVTLTLTLHPRSINAIINFHKVAPTNPPLLDTVDITLMISALSTKRLPTTKIVINILQQSRRVSSQEIAFSRCNLI